MSLKLVVDNGPIRPKTPVSNQPFAETVNVTWEEIEGLRADFHAWMDSQGDLPMPEMSDVKVKLRPLEEGEELHVGVTLNGFSAAEGTGRSFVVDLFKNK
jgi:hypothetical protein